MQNRIYLDNNATTAVDPLVAGAVYEALTDFPGNPSSIHHFGRESKRALMQARKTVGDYLGVSDREIVFVSGATEGLNLILQGISGHVISTDVEHSSVFDQLKRRESVTFVPVDAYGAATPESVLAAIRPDTKLIALMAANNETGVITDIEAIASIAEKANIPFVVDGVAFLGKETLVIPKGVSAMVFSGHKFHAPKGIGFAFVRKGLKLKPLVHGGGQEFGLRSGTEALPLAIGLAKALELESSFEKMRFLRDSFERQLKEIAVVNGEGPRVSNTSNLFFPGKDAETLLIQLDQNGIAASAGSACTSGALEPSRVLANMGYPTERVLSSIRFSLSRFTTKEEIDRCAATLLDIIKVS